MSFERRQQIDRVRYYHSVKTLDAYNKITIHRYSLQKIQ